MKKLISPNFALQENISKNIILIDGITRCGKSLLSNLIPTLKNVEQIQFMVLIEHLIPALSFGVVKKDFVKSSLRTLMNELAYNCLLSRNLNFRKTDQTGVYNHRNINEYLKRLEREEGDEIVKDLRDKEFSFPFMTHDLMVNLEYLDQLDLDYKMIQMYRHPIDNIYSWFTRGWGDRFDNDPRSFTLSLKYENNVLPWYCSGYEKEWLQYNSMERCVRAAIDLLYRSIDQHKKAKFPNKIHTITFEDFVQNSNIEMKKISLFLGKDITDSMELYMKKARCPRILKNQDRKNKLQKFKSGISNKLYQELLIISDRYENNLYGLKGLVK